MLGIMNRVPDIFYPQMIRFSVLTAIDIFRNLFLVLAVLQE
ncbi:hypothetical protein [Methanocalculus sp.]|nr:hypothetical protein [Methanocalculus sp.]MDG6251604.1 hypothetical protein [Methanocalculus sp.]